MCHIKLKVALIMSTMDGKGRGVESHFSFLQQCVSYPPISKLSVLTRMNHRKICRPLLVLPGGSLTLRLEERVAAEAGCVIVDEGGMGAAPWMAVTFKRV